MMLEVGNLYGNRMDCHGNKLLKNNGERAGEAEI